MPQPTAARIAAPLFCLLLATALHAGGSRGFDLRLETDLAIAPVSAGTCIAGLLVEPRPGFDPAWATWFDAGWIMPRDEGLGLAGDILALTPVLALPMLLDDFNLEEAATVGVMYAEAFLLANGCKDLLKAAVARPRPHAAGNDPDEYASFPSGHTTLAFMTAAFTASVLARDPDAGWAEGLTIALSYLAATACGASRVAAGEHHLTDVLAGALLGTAVGLAVPALHGASTPETGSGTAALSLAPASRGFELSVRLPL